MAATTCNRSLASQLGLWVELRAERRGDGSGYVVAVNHRDGRVVLLDQEEHDAPGEELLAILQSDGFLLERPPELDTPTTSTRTTERVAGYLRTLSVPWTGADRAVRWVHRHGGKALFSRTGLAAQAILFVVGTVAVVHALRTGSSVAWRAEPWMLPAIFAIDLLVIAIHELGHALVLVHHGRSVSAAGFALHLGSPAFFVESVDGVLLPRRTRMVQALAGPWAEWLATGLVAIVALGLPAGGAALIVHRFVVLNAITIGTNLLPFVGLDGYWLLSDGLREPDPAHRSAAERGRVVEALRNRRLPRPASVGWALWGTTNRLVAAAFLLLSGLFWYQRFGGVIVGALAVSPFLAAGVIALLGALVRPALQGLRPRCSNARQQASRVVDRARFRAERGWRSEAAEQLRHHPALEGFDDIALGVLAGRLVESPGEDLDGATVLVGRRVVGLAWADVAWVADRRREPVAA